MIFAQPERTRPKRKDKQSLYDKQNGRCMYCGIKHQINYFHVDHKIPLAKDGSDSLRNKQLLCSPCNVRKGSMTNAEFRRKYKILGNSPPSRVIPQSYFDKISQERAKKLAKKRRRECY